MSTPDKYFGVGGSYRYDASGNRVPDNDWPDRVLAESAPINTVIPPAPTSEPESPDIAPAPAKIAITNKE